MTTLAGQGSASSGSVNGVGTKANFNYPNGIALNPSNTFLYVADNLNNLIRAITLTTGTLGNLSNVYVAVVFTFN